MAEVWKIVLLHNGKTKGKADVRIYLNPQRNTDHSEKTRWYMGILCMNSETGSVASLHVAKEAFVLLRALSRYQFKGESCAKYHLLHRGITVFLTRYACFAIFN